MIIQSLRSALPPRALARSLALASFCLSASALAAPMSTEIVRDRLTDAVSATATLRSGDDRLELGCTASERRGIWPAERRRIWVRLRSHRWFREGDPFNGNIVFRQRFDDRPAHRRLWSVRERTALLTGRDRVERFVVELVNARQLVIRAPGAEGRRLDLVFPVEGAREAIGQALEACGDPFRSRM